MTDWNLVSFIIASKIRFKVLVCLNKSVKSPTDLKNEFDVPISRISSVLRELMRYGLVKNLTPERRKSKIFVITEKGKSVLDEINKMTSIQKGRGES